MNKNTENTAPVADSTVAKNSPNNTLKAKRPVGRPVGTGLRLASLGDLCDILGREAMVPTAQFYLKMVKLIFQSHAR